MTIHYCVAVGSPVSDVDEFDCAACRARLLEAFRPPHIIVPESRTRTVSLIPEQAPGAPVTEEGTHVLDAGVVSFAEESGGHWWVKCSCGWERGGNYARPTGRGVAERLVRHWSAHHTESPEEG